MKTYCAIEIRLASLLLLLLLPISLHAQICQPLNSLTVTSGFGWRKHPVTRLLHFHSGVDLSARFEPIYAVISGRITKQGYHSILGNFIQLEQEGVAIIYGHLSTSTVSIGQDVRSGQCLGMTGDTGRITGPHLHFSIKFSGNYINPLQFLIGLIHNQ